MKKLYFFDVDGTLLDYTHGIVDVSENLKRALKTIKERGDKYFICTGRAHGTIPENIRKLDAPGYSLCAGAFVTMGDEVIKNAYFSEETLKFMLDRFSRHEVFIILENGFDIYTNLYGNKEAMDMLRGWGMKVELMKPLTTHHGLKVNKISITFKNAEDAECMEDFSDHGITVLGQPAERSYDITLSSCTKADGIKCVRDYLKNEEVKIYAFGDNYNDIEMIKYADVGVAMGNAVEDLKDVADIVIDTVINDGIYKFLKETGEI